MICDSREDNSYKRRRDSNKFKVKNSLFLLQLIGTKMGRQRVAMSIYGIFLVS